MSDFRPRILVIGLGSIGQRHLRNLLSRGYREIAICRRSPADARATQEQLGLPTFADFREAEAWKPNVALIANPTSAHVSTALWALERGCHIFVEKPLSHDLADVDALVARASQAQVCAAVGCNLRFHQALETIRRAVDDGQIGRLLSARAEVGHYLPDWHPERDYRQAYSARSDLGGGALLTLIHEVDLMLWVAGDTTATLGVAGRVSCLDIDVDDVAEIVSRHVNGAVTSVHLDFLDRVYNRRSRWIGETGTIEWTWGAPVILLRQDHSAQVIWENPGFHLNDTYEAEIEDFLSCAATGATPRATLEDGRRALRVVAAVRRRDELPTARISQQRLPS